MLLMIDHYDSFTYNLYQYFLELDQTVHVVKVDQLATIEDFMLYDAVILSPGPGKPTDYPETLAFVAEYYQKIPILGICLGQQMLAEFFGGTVTNAQAIFHGKASTLRHQGAPLFNGLPEQFAVARYHSLIVTDLPDVLAETAWTADGHVMAMAHTSLPIMSVQFHPESVLTEHGHAMLQNFLTFGVAQSC